MNIKQYDYVILKEPFDDLRLTLNQVYKVVCTYDYGTTLSLEGISGVTYNKCLFKNVTQQYNTPLGKILYK